MRRACEEGLPLAAMAARLSESAVAFWEKGTAHFHAWPAQFVAHLTPPRPHSQAGRAVVSAGEPSRTVVATGSREEWGQLREKCTRQPINPLSPGSSRPPQPFLYSGREG